GYNLVIRNWYYTGLPENLSLRLFGYAWSFATIWPAIFEAADLISVAKSGRSGASGRSGGSGKSTSPSDRPDPLDLPTPPRLSAASVAAIAIGAAMLI